MRLTANTQTAAQTMADAVDRFNAEHPILDVFRGRELRRIGKEHHGPCPLCGGSDRFTVWPARGRAWCRQCTAGGDSLTWAMRLDGNNPVQRGETARYLTGKGYLGRAETPLGRKTTVKATPNTSPINLGAMDPMRAYYADFLRERRAILIVEGELTPRRANAEARRLLKLIREREHNAYGT